MKRAVAIAACGLTLTACSSTDWPSFGGLGSMSSPSPTMVQFESEPPGAEARTTTGQTCRTPCSLAIASNEFSVTFTLNGYQQQTVPVKFAGSTDAIDPNTNAPPVPRMVPNPVAVELTPTPPPAAARRRTTPKPQQQPVAQQQQQAPRQQQAQPQKRPAATPQPEAAQAPAPAPAAAWPPPPPPR